MLVEEVERHLLARQLPSRSLAAALADLHRQRLGRLGPGAADAGESARLVLLEKGPAAAEERSFADHRAGKLAQRRPARRHFAVRLTFGAVPADRHWTDAHIDLRSIAHGSKAGRARSHRRIQLPTFGYPTLRHDDGRPSPSLSSH